VLFITPWERDALRLVAQNRTTTEVASCLGVDVVDVGSHLTTLFSRMGASSPADALARASHRGLIEAADGAPGPHQLCKRSGSNRMKSWVC